MCEPEIIVPFGDVVGKLVAEREPDTNRGTAFINQVNPDDLRLLAAIERERRAGQIALGAARVEPSPL